MLKIIKNLADAYKAANESTENWSRDKVPETVQTGYGVYEKLSEAEKHRKNEEHTKEGEVAGEAAGELLNLHPINWFDPTGQVVDPLKEKIKDTGKILGGRHDYIEDIVNDTEGNPNQDPTKKDPTKPYQPQPDESPTQSYHKQYYDPIILDLNGDVIATATGWIAVNDEWREMVV